MRQAEIKERILSSKPYNENEDLSIALIQRQLSSRRAGPKSAPPKDAASNAFAALVAEGLLVRVRKGVVKRAGIGRALISGKWGRTISNEELEIEPMLFTTANDAQYISVMVMEKTDRGMG